MDSKIARAACIGGVLLAACAPGRARPERAPAPMSIEQEAADARAVLDRLVAQRAAGGARRGEIAEAYPRLRAELATAQANGTAMELGRLADQLRREMEGPRR